MFKTPILEIENKQKQVNIKEYVGEKSQNL